MGTTQSYDVTTLPDEDGSSDTNTIDYDSQNVLSQTENAGGKIAERKSKSSSSTALELETASISEIPLSIVPVHATTTTTTTPRTPIEAPRLPFTTPAQENGTETTPASSSTSQQLGVLSTPTDVSVSSSNPSASTETFGINVETTLTPSPPSSVPHPSPSLPSSQTPLSIPPSAPQFACIRTYSESSRQRSFQESGTSAADASCRIRSTAPREEIELPRAPRPSPLRASQLAAMAERQPPPYSAAISQASAAAISESSSADTVPRYTYPPPVFGPPLGPPPAYDEPGYEFPPPPLARRHREQRLSEDPQTQGNSLNRTIFFSDVLCVTCCAVCLFADMLMNTLLMNTINDLILLS